LQKSAFFFERPARGPVARQFARVETIGATYFRNPDMADGTLFPLRHF